MAIYLTKWLFVFANILALFLFIPGIALAAPVQFNTTSIAILTSVQPSHNLTPYLNKQTLPSPYQGEGLGVRFKNVLHPNSKRYSIIFAQTTKTASYATPAQINLTPLQRQELQAVRQRRNREIESVLNSSQRVQLTHNLRAGDNINQALEKLNLQPEQQEFVKAIGQFTNLKMKAISSRHLLKIRQK